MTEVIPASVSSPRGTYRRLALAALAIGLAGAGAVWMLWPWLRPVVGYFLYAIPAHLLISFLANEPALLAAAKTAPPGVVAVAGTAGCIVAAILDYALIGWFVNKSFVKRELDDTKVFRAAQRGFARAPFLLILASALLPVPFYPAKILAIAQGYPLARFVAAVVLGRLPRFYALALIGKEVQASGGALASAGAALALIGGWGIWRTVKRNRQQKAPPAS